MDNKITYHEQNDIDNTLSAPKIPSPNLRAILDFGPVYLAISFKF